MLSKLIWKCLSSTSGITINRKIKQKTPCAECSISLDERIRDTFQSTGLLCVYIREDARY